MSQINSKQKGKIGELEVVNILKSKGYNARRAQQFMGTKDSADVLCEDLPIHWEIKRVQSLNLSKTMRKAKEECGDKIPAIAHRKNHEEWNITMPFNEFLEVYL